ncbi:tyrosine-protein phosphatase, partial [Streptomyces sp. ERV7]|uniref:tyrosine-protein phosphatase n=1 Tax=Streptomyces sp. ERV7 TaxID=1322334 RepID=UPI000AD55E59
WRAPTPAREIPWPGYGRAPAAIMRFFLADLAARHGSVRGYAAELLGADEELVGALRAGLLESSAEPVPTA